MVASVAAASPAVSLPVSLSLLRPLMGSSHSVGLGARAMASNRAKRKLQQQRQQSQESSDVSGADADAAAAAVRGGGNRDSAVSEEVVALLSSDRDRASCTMALSAGAGGAEAADFTGMLTAMYVKWATRIRLPAGHGGPWRVTTSHEADPAGRGMAKSVVNIDGPYAYGLAKGENGVHRLVT
jgi:protein subunit release factor A